MLYSWKLLTPKDFSFYFQYGVSITISVVFFIRLLEMRFDSGSFNYRFSNSLNFHYMLHYGISIFVCGPKAKIWIMKPVQCENINPRILNSINKSLNFPLHFHYRNNSVINTFLTINYKITSGCSENFDRMNRAWSHGLMKYLRTTR